jgi:transcriptional regulator with XRE-family HTH domain
MDTLKNHPAVRLGAWLKTKRQKKGFIKRSFAGKILLTPAQYTEVELGVCHWLQEQQRQAVVTVLDLDQSEQTQLSKMLDAADKEIALSFSNVFSREDLEPVRYRWNGKSKKPGEFERETILNAVFA